RAPARAACPSELRRTCLRTREPRFTSLFGVQPCLELTWFRHERHTPAGLLARGSPRHVRLPRIFPSGCGSGLEPAWIVRSPLTVAGTAADKDASAFPGTGVPT